MVVTIDNMDGHDHNRSLRQSRLRSGMSRPPCLGAVQASAIRCGRSRIGYLAA